MMRLLRPSRVSLLGWLRFSDGQQQHQYCLPHSGGSDAATASSSRRWKATTCYTLQDSEIENHHEHWEDPVLMNSKEPVLNYQNVTRAVASVLAAASNNTKYRGGGGGGGEDNYDYHSRDALRIQIPTHSRGYRVLPFTWEELQTIVLETNDLAALSRSIPQQYEYEIYKIYLRQTWYSVYDHILCSKFGLTCEEVAVEGNEHNKEGSEKTLKKAVWDESVTASLPRLALVPNEFPYFVQKPIQHWVLWKLGDSTCTDTDISWAKQQLVHRIGPIRDFLHWTNPPHLKSIPEIDHVHILCLPEAGDPFGLHENK